MTEEEFMKTDLRSDMRVRHPKLGLGRITGCSSYDRLIEVQFDDELGTDWVRCENVEIIKPE